MKWGRPRLRSFGMANPDRQDVEFAPNGWVKPLLPFLPPEVASEVVRYARWRLKELALEDDEEPSA